MNLLQKVLESQLRVRKNTSNDSKGKLLLVEIFLLAISFIFEKLISFRVQNSLNFYWKCGQLPQATIDCQKHIYDNALWYRNFMIAGIQCLQMRNHCVTVSPFVASTVHFLT